MSREREKTAWLVAHLAEVERRNLALQAGHSSIYVYARAVLKLTDKMAYERAFAAKLALEIPETIGKLASGELNLTAASELWRTLRDVENAAKTPAKRAEARNKSFTLSPELPLATAKLDESNPAPVRKSEMRELLEKVSGKTRNETEAVLNEWKFERTGQPGATKPRHELRLQLTEEQVIAWDRMRDLLSHKLGGRNPEAAFAWLLEQGLERVDPVRIEKRAEARRAKRESDDSSEETLFTEAEATSESKGSKSDRPHIPVPTQRRVWIRCEGKCQYPDPVTGRICGASAFLDLDHIVPLVEGGSNEESNLRLSCASHNRRRHLWQAREAEFLFESDHAPTRRNVTVPSRRSTSGAASFANAS